MRTYPSVKKSLSHPDAGVRHLKTEESEAKSLSLEEKAIQKYMQSATAQALSELRGETGGQDDSRASVTQRIKDGLWAVLSLFQPTQIAEMGDRLVSTLARTKANPSPQRRSAFAAKGHHKAQPSDLRLGGMVTLCME